jgi:hypothetical protein
VHLILIVNNDLAGRDPRTAVPDFRLIGICQKANRCPLWRHCAVTNPGERFTTALQPETVQVDRCQLRAKVSAPRREKLKPSCMNRRLIWGRIGEIEN